MKRSSVLLRHVRSLALLSALLAGAAAADQRVVVTAVVDGDTVRVKGADGRVANLRLIGIDTPEMGSRDEPMPPERFAREATAYTRRTLDGRTVRLEFEPAQDRHDRYGRVLAYVFLDDGTFVNDALVRQGFARAYTRFPFRYKAQFLAAEAEARAAGRGLWGGLPTPGAAAAGPVIGNRRSRVYHRPGQRRYDAVAEANRVYFATAADAERAGYRPARK
jgi:micrococcal nuclease